MANEVDSPTRGYRTEHSTDPLERVPGEFCCEEEHPTLEAAFDCGMAKGWNPDRMSLWAIDWAFGLRAKVPTFGYEWQREHKIRKAYRDAQG